MATRTFCVRFSRSISSPAWPRSGAGDGKGGRAERCAGQPPAHAQGHRLGKRDKGRAGVARAGPGLVFGRSRDRSASAPVHALLCVAGFAITDLRVLFDLNDRHALAIWIKQGSLGGGLIILAALAGMGTPLPAAVATVARLALVVVLVRGDKNTPSTSRRASVTALLRDPRWLSLAGPRS